MDIDDLYITECLCDIIWKYKHKSEWLDIMNELKEGDKYEDILKNSYHAAKYECLYQNLISEDMKIILKPYHWKFYDYFVIEIDMWYIYNMINKGSKFNFDIYFRENEDEYIEETQGYLTKDEMKIENYFYEEIYKYNSTIDHDMPETKFKYAKSNKCMYSSINTERSRSF